MHRCSKRRFAAPAWTFAAMSLAACNSAAPPATTVVAPPSAPTSAVALPQGAGCTAAIGRYRAIQNNDLSMGHVNQSVYAQIQTEIGEAEAACAKGDDGKALSLLRASKARHGYPS